MRILKGNYARHHALFLAAFLRGGGAKQKERTVGFGVDHILIGNSMSGLFWAGEGFHL